MFSIEKVRVEAINTGSGHFGYNKAIFTVVTEKSEFVLSQDITFCEDSSITIERVKSSSSNLSHFAFDMNDVLDAAEKAINNIGEVKCLIVARMDLGMSQSELADALGLSVRQISNIETGSRPLQKQTALAVEGLLIKAGLMPSSVDLIDLTVSYSRDSMISWLTAQSLTYRECVDANAKDLADDIIDRFVSAYEVSFQEHGYSAGFAEDYGNPFGDRFEFQCEDAERAQDMWADTVGHVEVEVGQKLDRLYDLIKSRQVKQYMNPETGSVGEYDDWFYVNAAGETVNAVDECEVEEVVMVGGELTLDLSK